MSLGSAVNQEGVAPAAKSAVPAGPARKASIDDMNHDEIDAWLVSDEARPTPDRPSGVYGGDTMTMESYKELGKEKPAAKAPAPAVDRRALGGRKGLDNFVIHAGANSAPARVLRVAREPRNSGGAALATE